MSDKIPSLDDILKDGLRRIGADALCNPEWECGCTLDDFRPCSAGGLCPFESQCIPARIVGVDEHGEMHIEPLRKVKEGDHG